ncbi:hypothetical protein KQX54_017424 [Cotesia glomerata]|uniref:Uncharacterized protein n=1 Tax=Cotesia glomerata TaxID=32391 RepID=A0AAV7HEQ4_COTGL|nr:hypothetical protein KQX54_017424 [Cotesia glomerata]
MARVNKNPSRRGIFRTKRRRVDIATACVGYNAFGDSPGALRPCCRLEQLGGWLAGWLAIPGDDGLEDVAGGTDPPRNITTPLPN